MSRTRSEIRRRKPEESLGEFLRRMRRVGEAKKILCALEPVDPQRNLRILAELHASVRARGLHRRWDLISDLEEKAGWVRRIRNV